MKKIGVLTSGGDSQGMNSAIYATVRSAIAHGMQVYGIRNGYRGLLAGNAEELTVKDVEGIVYRGGTVLGTARCEEMKTKDGLQKGAATLAKLGLEGLVIIGGDGSFRGAKELSTNYGVKVIGIPGTIDNDLAYTDYTLGFDSAVAVVVNNVVKLRDTMSANDRSCVVEVMGRDCGDIAVYSALACGADAVCVPEVKYNPDALADIVRHNISVGKFDNMIIVAEGIRSDGTLDKGREADKVMNNLLRRIPDLNVRSVVLGHLQRGGDASVFDRRLGILMGNKAVQCLAESKTDRVIGIKNDKVFDEDLLEALARPSVFNRNLYDIATSIVKY